MKTKRPVLLVILSILFIIGGIMSGSLKILELSGYESLDSANKIVDAVNLSGMYTGLVLMAPVLLLAGVGMLLLKQWGFYIGLIACGVLLYDVIGWIIFDIICIPPLSADIVLPVIFFAESVATGLVLIRNKHLFLHNTEKVTE